MAKKIGKAQIERSNMLPFLPRGIAHSDAQHPDKISRRNSLQQCGIDQLVPWAESIDPEFSSEGKQEEVKANAISVILEYEYEGIKPKPEPEPENSQGEN